MTWPGEAAAAGWFYAGDWRLGVPYSQLLSQSRLSSCYPICVFRAGNGSMQLCCSSSSLCGLSFSDCFEQSMLALSLHCSFYLCSSNTASAQRRPFGIDVIRSRCRCSGSMFANSSVTLPTQIGRAHCGEDGYRSLVGYKCDPAGGYLDSCRCPDRHPQSQSQHDSPRKMTAAFALPIATMGKAAEVTRGIAILATLSMAMLGGAWAPTFIFPKWLQALTVWQFRRAGQCTVRMR
jgi:hypothetical protein